MIDAPRQLFTSNKDAIFPSMEVKLPFKCVQALHDPYNPANGKKISFVTHSQGPHRLCFISLVFQSAEVEHNVVDADIEQVDL